MRNAKPAQRSVVQRATSAERPRSLEAAEIIRRVRDWAGGSDAAEFWFRSEPIPAFGDRTAEAIVESGQGTALRRYLDALALGGFA